MIAVSYVLLIITLFPFVSDTPVVQAVAKFNNQGTFTAADGIQHPFSIEGVVTFTQIDSKTTRIRGTYIISVLSVRIFTSRLNFMAVQTICNYWETRGY